MATRQPQPTHRSRTPTTSTQVGPNQTSTTAPSGARSEEHTQFDRHPRIGVAWQALQELYGLYAADDRDGALEALERFCDLHETGEIPESGDVVNTILAWPTKILAFHDPAAGWISNGRLEGTNNKLQVLRRVAYGFVNRSNYEARGILARGPIRSPQPRPAPLTP